MTKTNRAYWLKRLEAEFPDLHRDVKAGRITLNQANEQAGLVHKRFHIRAEPHLVADSLAAKFSTAELRIIRFHLNEIIEE